MNEELLESANLYALGLLTGNAKDAFEQELRSNPALQQEVHALQEAALALAHSAPQSPPPPDLRDALISAFAAGETTLKPQPQNPAAIAPSPQRPGRRNLMAVFIPWAAAASLAFLFMVNKDAVNTAKEETAQARKEASAQKEREAHLVDMMRISEAERLKLEENLTNLRTRVTAAETTLAARTGERDTLLAEVQELRDSSQLDKTRIAVLGSLLKNQPQAVAVSVWRQESQKGILVVENMPALPPGRDYQLWVIDPNLKTPVSAGVFKVDASGKVRIEFEPVRKIQSAFKFAVTIEEEGGADLPTMDQMVVIGG